MQTGMQTTNWLGLSTEKQASLLARPAMADSAELSKTVGVQKTGNNNELVAYISLMDGIDQY